MSPVMADKVQNGTSTAKIWGFLARRAAGGTMKPMPRSSCCHRCYKPKYRRVAKALLRFSAAPKPNRFIRIKSSGAEWCGLGISNFEARLFWAHIEPKAWRKVPRP